MQASARCVSFQFTIKAITLSFISAVKNFDRIDLQIPGIRISSRTKQNKDERDLIFLSFDKYGHRIENGVSAKQYHPILKAKGHLTQLDYYVDIRQLFFLDVSEIPRVDSFYSEKFHLKPNSNSSKDELLYQAYIKGGIVSLRLTTEPANSILVQFYQPAKSGFLDFIIHPILDLIDPIGSN